MFGDGALTFREFVMQEKVPLSAIHREVLEFLQDRDDTVVFGAQAVNAYVNESRMTQDINLLSINARALAQDLRKHLREKFHIAIRIRELKNGQAYRLYQARKSGSRHLIDIRNVDTLPESQRIGRVLVISPAELIAGKVIAYHQRKGQPKSGTDWRDLAMLLLAFPELKRFPGTVGERLRKMGVNEEVIKVWKTIVEQEIHSADDEDDIY